MCRATTLIVLLPFHFLLLYFTSYSRLDSMLSPSFYSVVKPIRMVENIVITELLVNPFSMRPLNDKLTILKKDDLLHNFPIYNIKLRQKYIQDTFSSLSVIMLTG
jgi:hypothetical protein